MRNTSILTLKMRNGEISRFQDYKHSEAETGHMFCSQNMQAVIFYK